MTMLFWTGFGFLVGAMPFSYWLGRLVLHTDIRLYGDGNPGAISAWRAGTWRVGLPAMLLDYLKGTVPVSLAHLAFGISGWGLVPIALAPVLGHAFSPFMRFRGGKAVAATFGIWTGVLVAEGPMVLGLFLGLFYMVQTADAWSVILGMLGFLAWLLLRQPEPVILGIWGGNMLILVWKHRRDLRQPLHLRPFILKLLRRDR
jgi:glycerol-3-phosphate acyltransferase PlsY